MKFFNQLSYNKETIGDTNILLSRYGCTICSICMGASRLYPKIDLTPVIASKSWKFTKDGLLIWRATDFGDFQFMDRRYGEPNANELDIFVRSKDSFVILEVNHSHWVLVYSYPITGVTKSILIVDPLGGKIKPLALTKYKITGFAIFTKKPKK